MVYANFRNEPSESFSEILSFRPNHFGNSDIPNCGVPTEKVSEILYFHLKSVMQEGASFIKDTIQTSRTK